MAHDDYAEQSQRICRRQGLRHVNDGQGTFAPQGFYIELNREGSKDL
jgi:hypothetical protein